MPGSTTGGGGVNWAPPVEVEVVRLVGGAVPPVMAVALAGAVSAASDTAIAMDFFPPTVTPPWVGGDLHWPYRRARRSTKVLQKAAHGGGRSRPASARRAEGPDSRAAQRVHRDVGDR